MSNARISALSQGYLSGAALAYRPLFSTNDIVYRKSEVNAFTHKSRPYKVLWVKFRTNTSAVPLAQDGTTTITADVASQAASGWCYDLQEVKRLTATTFETGANASGPRVNDVVEADLASLADIKTYIQTEVGDWTDPAD